MSADVLEAELAQLGVLGRARLAVATLVIRSGLVVAPAPVVTAARSAGEAALEEPEDSP